MRKFSLKSKIYTGFVVVSVIMFFTTLYIILQLNSISEKFELVFEHPFKVSNAIRNVQIEIYKNERLVQNIGLTESDYELDSLMNKIILNNKIIDNELNLIYSQYLGNKTDIETLVLRLNLWKEYQEKLYKLKKEYKTDSIDYLVKYDNHKLVDDIISKSKVIAAFAANKAETSISQSIEKKHNTFIFIIVILILVSVIVALISHFLAKNINKPVQQLKNDAQKTFALKYDENLLKSYSEDKLFSYIIEEIHNSYQEIEQQNEEIKSQNEQIANYVHKLEDKVNQRTNELLQNQEKLILQNQELSKAEMELRASNEELVTTSDALKILNEELIQAKEKSEENEQKIKEQARIFDLVFENSMDSIVLLDKDYNFIKVSKSYAISCQKEIHVFENKNHFEMYPSNLKDEFDEYKAKKQIYKRPAIQ